MRLCVRSPWIVIILFFLLVSGMTPAAHAIQDTAFLGLSQTLVSNTNVNLPGDLVLDAAGDAFIADSGNNRIVEVTAHGNVSSVSVTGLTLALNSPSGIAVDGANNLYIADTGNNRVVQVAPAGTGSVVSMGSVTLSAPQGIAVDLSGDLFIADTGNNRIVEVASGGSAAALSIAVASGASALASPSGLAVNVAGTLYVADSGNNRIVTVSAGGSAGAVLNIDTSQLGAQTAFSSPGGVAVDSLGDVYIADTGNSRVVAVNTSGVGLVLNTPSLDLPQAVALDAFGSVYIADTGDSQCLRVSPPVDVTSSAAVFGTSLNKSAVGFGHVQLGSSSGVTLTLPFQVGSNVTLGTPAVRVLIEGAASLDFTVGASNTCTAGASDENCSVQIKFLPTAPGLRTGAVVLYDNSSPQNQILTIPLYGWSDSPVAVLAPNTGTVIDSGGVTTSAPFQLALDGQGNIYTANSSGMTAVKITAGGGSGTVLNTGGNTLGTVAGIAVDGAGDVFIADNTDSDIVVVTPQGLASVLSINGLSPSLSTPAELNFDAAGNLYIADAENSRIVVVTGLQVIGGSSSGIGSAVATGAYTPGAQLYSGVAVDPKGTIYIADGVNNRILQVTAAGAASVLSPTGITFSDPQGVAVDGMGNLYIADSGNNRIVEITTPGITTPGTASVLSIGGVPAPAALSSPTGLAVDASGNLYIADSGNNRIVFVNVSGAALTFSSTAPGSTSNDSPMTATVTNLGNQPLVLSANPIYTANFSVSSSDTNLCTSTTSLAAGAGCDVAVNFTPQSAGSLSASITVTDNTLNVAASTQQVAVSGKGGKNTPAIDWTTPAPITYGATLSGLLNASALNASTPVPGTFTYTATPTNGSASAVTSATVLSAGTYTLGVSFTPTDTTTYATATGQVTLLVNQVTPTITWATPAAITYGAALSSAQLNASSTVAGSFVYTPASGTVETAGQHTLSVTLTPTDSIDYATATAQVTLTVNQVTPAITWAAPAAIAPGTALSGAQLNASSPVAGSFAYTPAAGTVESAGQHTLSVIFTPTDTTDYTTATAMVTLTVQGTLSIVWHPAKTTIPYGTTLSGILNASATSGNAVVPGTFAYVADPLSGQGFAVTDATVLPAGMYTLAAEFKPNANSYQQQLATVEFTVTAETPSVALVSSVNPVLVTNPITLTATIAAAFGTPTGKVNFFDGTTQLATVALSAGTASFTTSSRAAGTHSLTAVYNGDANFVAVTSSSVAEVVEDFSITPPSGSGTSQTVAPGGTAVYALNLTPSFGITFPTPVVLSLTGLPPGAASTVTPSSFTQTSHVIVRVAVPAAEVPVVGSHRKQPWDHSIPTVFLAILLLPFGARLRRLGRRLGNPISFLLLLALGFAAVEGMSGCGSNGSSSQPEQTYTMVLTATSGSLSRNITLTLTVE